MVVRVPPGNAERRLFVRLGDTRTEAGSHRTIHGMLAAYYPIEEAI